MSEPLEGKNQKELDREDAILASLSNLAFPEKQVVPKLPSGSRTSRFWFRVETPRETVEKLKADMKPKTVTHIDRAVVERLAKYKAQAPKELKSHINEVREFFLTEIAPLTLAASGGALQAVEVVQRLLDTEVDMNIVSRLENMVNRAATLKMALFVLNYFKLPREHLESLLGSHGNPQDKLLQQLLQQIKALPTKEDLAKK